MVFRTEAAREQVWGSGGLRIGFEKEQCFRFEGKTCGEIARGKVLVSATIQILKQ